jgi:Na+-driven multidrug efflux pump
MAAMLGLVFTSIMLVFGKAFYRALGASDDALDAALQYSNVLFLGSIPFWVFGASASILRGSGNANYPALVGAIGGFITLAVSPLLIFGAGPVPALGIMGAASAIVAYNLIAALVLLRAISSKNSAAPLSVRALIPQWQYTLAILKISVPSAANTLLTNLTFLVLTGLVAPYGTTATAGYGTGGRLEYLLIPIVFGIGSALVPLIAASDGAGNFPRVRLLTRTGALLAAGMCGIIGAAAALYPQGWMAVFTDDAAVTTVGGAYLVRVGPAYAFLGLGLALYFAAQGRGRTTQPLLASLTRLLVAGIGGTLAIGFFGWGLDTLFTLMAAGLVLYGMVMVFVMRKELGWSANA